MGWITTHRTKGETTAAFLGRESLGEDYAILGSAIVDNTFYAAVRHPAGRVFAYVALLSLSPRSHHNFGWKSQDESQGPCDAKCPTRILDLLDPTDDQCAITWRERCRAYAAKPMPRKGDMVEFAKPVRFVDGEERGLFVYSGKGSVFLHPDWANCHYRISNWRDEGYHILDGLAAAVPTAQSGERS